MNELKTLATLAVGDKVLITSGRGRTRAEAGIVERATAHRITVNGVEYRRRDGDQVGADRSTWSLAPKIEPYNPAVHDDRLRYDALVRRADKIAGRLDGLRKPFQTFTRDRYGSLRSDVTSEHLAAIEAAGAALAAAIAALPGTATDSEDKG